MKRTTQMVVSKKERQLQALTGIITDVLSREGFALRQGWQYGGKRKLYKALGYPEDKELTFKYFFGKYDRQDIATAIVDRPVDATWKGDIVLLEKGVSAEDSQLNKAWKQLNKDLKLKQRLCKVDKLCEIGRYSLLLMGLDDVVDTKDFKKAVSGQKRKLLYVKQIAEAAGTIETWDIDPKSPRYGMPLMYKIRTGSTYSLDQGDGVTSTAITEQQDLLVHHSRILHYVKGNLTSEVIGVSVYKAIINRLIDIEKILGGDAEMFWRGARPGYTATEKEDYQLSPEAAADLMTELDNYEHDLRRFITAKGVDIKALEQQVANPLEHLDIQLQAISAKTGIPKRILIGSERGELSSTQDKDQWWDLIKTRQEEHSEVTIFRPFIDYLMKYKILPPTEEYEILWTDVFAPSEADKVALGEKRSIALKNYSDAALASEVIPPPLVGKYLLGMNEEQSKELNNAMDLQKIDEIKLEGSMQEEDPEPVEA